MADRDLFRHRIIASYVLTSVTKYMIGSQEYNADNR